MATTQIPAGTLTPEQVCEIEWGFMDTEVTLSLRDGKRLSGEWMRQGYVYGSESDPAVALNVSGFAVMVPFRLIRSIRHQTY